MKKGDLLDGVKELLGKKGTLLRHGYKEKGMLNFSANTCQSLKEYVSNSAKGQSWKLKEKKVEAKVFTLHVSKYPIAVGAIGLGIYRII